MGSLRGSRGMRPKLGLLLLLLLVHIFLFSSAAVYGQPTPHAMYESHIKVGSDANGSVSVVYSVFAGDQSLHVSNTQLSFPVYNSTAIIETSIRIDDQYGQNYTWSWDYYKKFLKVSLGPLDIPAGGKYEINLNYDQSFLCQITNNVYYFVYEWDFSQIGQSPYTVTQYSLIFERPADGLLDSYPVTFVGTSPSSLTSYMTQSGASTAFNYTFFIQDVTLNVYYDHLYGLSTFAMVTFVFIFVFILALAITIYAAIRRRKS